jgi:hypothetical protein
MNNRIGFGIHVDKTIKTEAIPASKASGQVRVKADCRIPPLVCFAVHAPKSERRLGRQFGFSYITGGARRFQSPPRRGDLQISSAANRFREAKSLIHNFVGARMLRESDFVGSGPVAAKADVGCTGKIF